MPNTEALLALIPDHAAAFADPEATPEDPTLLDMAEPDEEGRTGESPQDVLAVDSGVIEFEQKEKWFDSDRLTAPEWCQYYLGQLKNDPKLFSIAADYLEKLADIAEMNKVVSSKKYHSKGSGNPRPLAEVVDEASAPVFIDLPETHARVQTEGCASGMCPADH